MVKPRYTRDVYIARIMVAATAHAEQSEPDMEIGDLQALVMDLWHAMTSEQRAAFERNTTWRDFVRQWS